MVHIFVPIYYAQVCIYGTHYCAIMLSTIVWSYGAQLCAVMIHIVVSLHYAHVCSYGTHYCALLPH